MNVPSVMGLDERDAAILLRELDELRPEEERERALLSPEEERKLPTFRRPNPQEIAHATAMRVYQEVCVKPEARSIRGIAMGRWIDDETHYEMERRGYRWDQGRFAFIMHGKPATMYPEVRSGVAVRLRQHDMALKRWVDEETHAEMERMGYAWDDANYLFFLHGMPAAMGIYQSTRERVLQAVAARATEFFQGCAPHRMLPRNGGSQSLQMNLDPYIKREPEATLALPTVHQTDALLQPAA